MAWHRNFKFQTTIALYVPRQAGVGLGKADFLGRGCAAATPGADHARHSSVQAAMADAVLSRLRLRLRGDEPLLDLGSGDGKPSARIAARLPH